MDKLSKFNNRIFLFIKKIKNLQAQEKGKLKRNSKQKKNKISGVEWKRTSEIKLRLLSHV